jgi:hypothetical protein
MKAVTNTIEMKHTNTPKQTNKKKLRQAAITSAHIHTATLCAPFTPRILPTASKPTSGEQRKAYRRAIGGCPTPASQESTGKHSRRKNRKTAYHNVRRVQKANMRHVRNNVAFQVGREGDNDKNRYSITKVFQIQAKRCLLQRENNRNVNKRTAHNFSDTNATKKSYAMVFAYCCREEGYICNQEEKKRFVLLV